MKRIPFFSFFSASNQSATALKDNPAFESHPSAGVYWLLLALAAFSFLFTLPIRYVGEEAVYPLMSYEMWFRGEYLTPIMYGAYYSRPPLYNLMIIPVAQFIGWDHMLVAARLVTLIATLSTSLLLAWFAKRLTKDKTFAVFTALVYLTLGDVFFYGGWLCYSDPVFAMFVLASMIFGWLALTERRYSYLAVGVAVVSAGFLSKVLTAYVFYGVTMLIIAYRRREWSFLRSWQSLLLHASALIFPLLWFHSVPAGNFQSHGMLADITDKLIPRGGWDYLKQVLIFPLQTVEKLSPIALVLIYAYWRRRKLGKWREAPDIVTVGLIVLVNWLPYWLSPQSGGRYLIPLFPFASLFLAYLAFYGEPRVRESSIKWIAAAIVVKLALGLWGFPFFDKRFRGSYEAAQDIAHIAVRENVYATDVSASGITTVAQVDLLIYPKPPLLRPPVDFKEGFVISYTPDENIGAVYKKYRIGKNNDLYLLCRGAACMH